MSPARISEEDLGRVLAGGARVVGGRAAGKTVAAAVAAARPANKFNAKRVTGADGTTFDSAGEQARDAELRLEERAGAITNLRRQVSIPLTCGGRPVVLPGRSGGKPRQVVIRVDWTYERTSDGVEVIEDFKGFDTEVGRLKRAVLSAETGREIKLTGAAAGRRRSRSKVMGSR